MTGVQAGSLCRYLLRPSSSLSLSSETRSKTSREIGVPCRRHLSTLDTVGAGSHATCGVIIWLSIKSAPLLTLSLPEDKMETDGHSDQLSEPKPATKIR